MSKWSPLELSYVVLDPEPVSRRSDKDVIITLCLSDIVQRSQGYIYEFRLHVDPGNRRPRMGTENLSKAGGPGEPVVTYQVLNFKKANGIQRYEAIRGMRSSSCFLAV